VGIPGPQPPWDMVMNQTGQTVFTVFVIIPWVVLLALAGRALVRDRSAAPLLFMLGGMCSIVMEPVVDVMGMCFFPIHGQWVGLETFAGRPVPIFMWPVYSWFVGGQAFLLWRTLQRGTLTGPRLWRHWLTAWGVNIVLETPGVLMGVYTYYGAQPFNLWGLPLWWPAVNATMPVVAAFGVHKSWPHLRGWRLLAIVPLVPMADGLVNGGLAWPTWSALHSDVGYAATYPASILTIALAALAIWVLTNHLPKAGPAERAVPAEPAASGR
jgi:hypothetical protein